MKSRRFDSLPEDADKIHPNDFKKHADDCSQTLGRIRINIGAIFFINEFAGVDMETTLLHNSINMTENKEKQFRLPEAIHFSLVMMVCFFLVACTDIVPTKEVRLVDSLNGKSYDYRYRDIDSSFQYANQALRRVKLYKSGKAEAFNNLGFCSFMWMDFEKAEGYYKEVYKTTQNELELLIADIGLMKICQRTAMSKEFYDYRNSALRRMKRIREDRDLFIDRHETLRLRYAFSEFFMVSAAYYYYFQQKQEAVASMDRISKEALSPDTSQLLYYHYIKGIASLVEGDTWEERTLNEFDELYATWKLASQNDYPYFEGNGMLGLADRMCFPDDFELLRMQRGHLLEKFALPVDTLLPLRLSQKALTCFRRYNDLYQIAGAYVSIGRYLNVHGRYQEALDTLSKALDCVNRHHIQHYHHAVDTVDRLLPFAEEDTASTGIPWMMKENVKTVPEWIARIREQLSVSYAGLGMRFASNYNRNAYLDILNYTRQDKELEGRYLSLEAESKQTTIVLFLVIIGLVLFVILWWFLSKRSKVKYQLDVERLQQLLALCRDITSFIPMNVSLIQQGVDRLFGKGRVALKISDEGKAELAASCRLNRDEKAWVQVLEPYIEWATDNERVMEALSDERVQLEKKRYIYEQHIAKNKRENLEKKACLAIVNGINPYIDRILNEVHKLIEKKYIEDDSLKKEKLQYIDELVTTINEYNDILTLWIKMKQGTLSLAVETFALNDLFDLVRKGKRAFEMKKQTLVVEPTSALVKADRALTLFMINTLSENARKYTPDGGSIKIYATLASQYVEISVEDNGRGLSDADIARIIGEKVYDSKTIGLKDAKDPEHLMENKGSGFGLMNCKGIIEKYKKTNDLFRVCTFGIESKVGVGSRFFFRLPLGVRKIVSGLIGLLFCANIVSCSYSPAASVVQNDSITAVTVDTVYDKLLNEASDYANAAYFSNVDGQYEAALQYIDSAMMLLNEHHGKYALPNSAKYSMKLVDEETPAEIQWWNESFESDYHVILDIRNEAAVAFLALRKLEAYDYNNTAFTDLYKLQGEDRTLEGYCRQLERSNINKTIGIILCILLLLVSLVCYYFLYIRKRLQNRLNLEQVLEINKKVFMASSLRPTESEEGIRYEEEVVGGTLQRIVDESFLSVNELFAIHDMGIAVYNEVTHCLEYASKTGKKMSAIVQQSFDSGTPFFSGTFRAIPLFVEAKGEQECVGVLYLEQREGAEQETDLLLFELIARYVGIVAFNVIVKLLGKFRDIESAHEEAYRASWEDGMLHVQNMVLDNCLSTIKHETVYYPNKIKQIVTNLSSQQLSKEEEREAITAILELIEYYKGIFSILSSCASRQLEEITFRRSVIQVNTLFDVAEKYFKRKTKQMDHIQLLIEPIEVEVIGDVNQLNFLLENLIDEALTCDKHGTVCLKAVKEADNVRFLFIDKRREKSLEELNNLFHPNLSRMTAGEKGRLYGTEYLLCKQIIRDHDEFAGKRGCRINAEQAEGGGFVVYFTLPCK